MLAEPMIANRSSTMQTYSQLDDGLYRVKRLVAAYLSVNIDLVKFHQHKVSLWHDNGRSYEPVPS
jgi:hypothetical protein